MAQLCWSGMGGGSWWTLLTPAGTAAFIPMDGVVTVSIYRGECVREDIEHSLSSLSSALTRQRIVCLVDEVAGSLNMLEC